MKMGKKQDGVLDGLKSRCWKDQSPADCRVRENDEHVTQLEGYTLY